MNGQIPIIGQKSETQIVIEHAINVLGQVALKTKDIKIQSEFNMNGIPLKLLIVDRGGFLMAKAGVAQLLDSSMMTQDMIEEFKPFIQALEYIFGEFEDNEELDDNSVRTGMDRT